MPERAWQDLHDWLLRVFGAVDGAAAFAEEVAAASAADRSTLPAELCP